jgi:hypothetical protein
MPQTSSSDAAGFAAALALALLLPITPSHAFTFTDGKSVSCNAGGQAVEEVDVDASQGFTGKTIRTSSGYQIVWNPAKLKALPPDVHDYIFFHECAHAHVPTVDEIQANCVGLQDMRAAGRAGAAVETRLAAFYGPGNSFWVSTLTCANAAVAAPAKQ